MTTRDRTLVAVVAGLVALLAIWMLALAPKRHEASDIGRQLGSERAALTAARTQATQGRAAKAAMKDNLRSLAGATRAVPRDAGVPELLRQLERTSHRTKVAMTAVTTSETAPAPAAAPAADPAAGAPAATSTAPTPLGLTLTFDGSFFKLQKFFTRLDRFIRVSKRQVEGRGRLLAISGLQLAVGEKGFPDLTASVAAQVFSLPSLPGAPTANAAVPAGAAAAAPMPPAQPASTTTPAPPEANG